METLTEEVVGTCTGTPSCNILDKSKKNVYMPETVNILTGI
jgi:hypothetical protein